MASGVPFGGAVSVAPVTTEGSRAIACARCSGNSASVKRAVTSCEESIVTRQSLVPVQPPPSQPANVMPASGTACNVTGVLRAKSEKQVAPQFMPAGVLVTVPVPFPLLLTVSRGGVLAQPENSDVFPVLLVAVGGQLVPPAGS